VASPYRVQAASVDRPGGVLLYLAGDRERHVAPARSAFQTGVVGVTACVAVAAADLPQLGAGLLARSAQVSSRSPIAPRGASSRARGSPLFAT
jgi:hypothetical protein